MGNQCLQQQTKKTKPPDRSVAAALLAHAADAEATVETSAAVTSAAVAMPDVDHASADVASLPAVDPTLPAAIPAAVSRQPDWHLATAALATAALAKAALATAVVATAVVDASVADMAPAAARTCPCPCPYRRLCHGFSLLLAPSLGALPGHAEGHASPAFPLGAAGSKPKAGESYWTLCQLLE